MTENETVSLECLFLHDTQMAELERGQAELSRIFNRLRNAARAEAADLPFSPLPPFCPATGTLPSGKIVLGDVEATDGWIVRKVSGTDGGTTREAANVKDRIALPGYPPLPDACCFILGHAGGLADAVIAESRADRDDRTVPAISARARYRATLTLEISRDDSFYSCVRTVGSPRWETAD